MCACAELAAKDTVSSTVKAAMTDFTIPSVVPHSPDVIIPVINHIVDKFWECRRYGESWDSSNPPSDLFDDCDSGSSIDAVTQRIHRHLVFDLVAETITEIYRTEEDDQHSYCPDAFVIPKRATVWPRPEPPTTLDELKPHVETQVLRQLRLRDAVPPSAPKWTSCRKQDTVDLLLVKELGEEEPGWVDYTAAEFDAKNQLVDSLMELLLNDTVQTIQQAIQFRQMTVE